MIRTDLLRGSWYECPDCGNEARTWRRIDDVIHAYCANGHTWDDEPIAPEPSPTLFPSPIAGLVDADHAAYVRRAQWFNAPTRTLTAIKGGEDESG